MLSAIRAVRLALPAGVLALLFALAGCGGGGGPSAPGVSPRPDPNPSKADYAAEYGKQTGLAQIHAADIYRRGGTGAGIKVGVFDSGAAEHADLNYAARLYWSDGGVHTDADDQSDIGHGTHVAGIIAARKNGIGMHGVAYDAQIVSFKLPFGDDDESIFNSHWSEGLYQLESRGVKIVNNSWGLNCFNDQNTRTRCTVEDFGTADVQSWPLQKLQSYVAGDGVVVFAAGNDRKNAVVEPSVQAGLPHLVDGIENGWLAVVAVDGNGVLADFSQTCGVAANWCLAAPGVGIYSTVSGGYGRLTGTSQAAPHVSGALAALKHLFPNLSYHEVRERLLMTADDSGIYRESTKYGQGLLDLDEASKSVDGTGFALGARDSGPLAQTAGAFLYLPPGAVSKYLAGRNILLLDNYQRAPFRAPLERFAGARGVSYLGMQDLDFAAPGAPARPERADGQDAWSLALGGGDAAHLPGGDYLMAEKTATASLDYRSAAGALRLHAATASGQKASAPAGYGIAEWGPRTVLAASFTSAEGGWAVGAAAASDLERPMGWRGEGALAISGDSYDIGWRRRLAGDEGWRLDIANRIAWLKAEPGPLVRFDDAVLATARLDASARLAPGLDVAVRLGVERPLAAADGRLKAAASVDRDGNLDYDDIRMKGRDFLSFNTAALGLAWTSGNGGASLSAGVAAVQDGFGEVELLYGARSALRF